jgi:hypothetical protein
MTKTEYIKLANKFGARSIHFTIIRDGKQKINKEVEAK